MFKKITLTLGVLALITATATKTAAKPFNRVGYACVNLTAVGSSAANIDSALKQADGVAYQASIPGGAKVVTFVCGMMAATRLILVPIKAQVVAADVTAQETTRVTQAFKAQHTQLCFLIAQKTKMS